MIKTVSKPRLRDRFRIVLLKSCCPLLAFVHYSPAIEQRKPRSSLCMHFSHNQIKTLNEKAKFVRRVSSIPKMETNVDQDKPEEINAGSTCHTRPYK